jgi:aminoglycoside phosphotransferase (APT) family kinase protein
VDELLAQRVAAAAGLAPAVVTAHPEGHWLLMEFVDAPVWNEERLHSEQGVSRLCGQLARLYGLSVPADLPLVNPVSIADAYLQRLAGHDAGSAAALVPLRDRVAALGKSLAEAGAPPVLNHGDLMASNLLGDAPLLVDWEYAQVAEPGWDVACLLTYYPKMARFLPRLLASAGMAGTATTVLEMQLERFTLLNSLWERLAAYQGG